MGLNPLCAQESGLAKAKVPKCLGTIHHQEGQVAQDPQQEEALRKFVTCQGERVKSSKDPK
jgi:hypothetical protein